MNDEISMDEKLGEMLDDLFLLYPLFQKNILVPKNFEGNRKIALTYYLTLILLKDNGNLSISEIGNHIGMKKQNMTYLTNKLVEEGLVQRLHDLSDRRVIKIAITPKGNEYLHEWRSSKIKETKRSLPFDGDEDLKKLHSSIENIKKVFLRIDN